MKKLSDYKDYTGIDVSINVTNDEVFKQLREWFKELDMLDFEQKRSEYDYYSILAEKISPLFITPSVQKAESEEDNEEE